MGEWWTEVIDTFAFAAVAAEACGAGGVEGFATVEGGEGFALEVLAGLSGFGWFGGAVEKEVEWFVGDFAMLFTECGGVFAESAEECFAGVGGVFVFECQVEGFGGGAAGGEGTDAVVEGAEGVFEGEDGLGE